MLRWWAETRRARMKLWPSARKPPLITISAVFSQGSQSATKRVLPRPDVAPDHVGEVGCDLRVSEELGAPGGKRAFPGFQIHVGSERHDRQRRERRIRA